ncbi:MAG: hypothetical protein Q8N56_04510 [bacterium]|nr:hypothetical protein [bacterium]
MINLLSPQEKTVNFTRKKLKLVLIFEYGFFLFLICLLLAVSAIRIYLVGEVNLKKIGISEREAEVDISKIVAFEKEMADLNKHLADINDFYRTSSDVSGIMNKVFQYLPSGSYLTDVSFRRETGKSKLVLNGFVSTREKLLEFKKSLEKENIFKKIDFPASNWVSATNINFYLGLEI